MQLRISKVLHYLLSQNLLVPRDGGADDNDKRWKWNMVWRSLFFVASALKILSIVVDLIPEGLERFLLFHSWKKSHRRHFCHLSHSLSKIKECLTTKDKSWSPWLIRLGPTQPKDILRFFLLLHPHLTKHSFQSKEELIPNWHFMNFWLGYTTNILKWNWYSQQRKC